MCEDVYTCVNKQIKHAPKLPYLEVGIKRPPPLRSHTEPPQPAQPVLQHPVDSSRGRQGTLRANPDSLQHRLRGEDAPHRAEDAVQCAPLCIAPVVGRHVVGVGEKCVRQVVKRVMGPRSHSGRDGGVVVRVGQRAAACYTYARAIPHVALLLLACNCGWRVSNAKCVCSGAPHLLAVARGGGGGWWWGRYGPMAGGGDVDGCE